MTTRSESGLEKAARQFLDIVDSETFEDNPEDMLIFRVSIEQVVTVLRELKFEADKRDFTP